MDVPSAPSPPCGGNGPAMRRRKKRSTGNNITAPGSSLTGLNRNSIVMVELIRGTMGYGFTISGQKPCLLRCIVDNSPAHKAGLRPGNCLVGVNGKDVSHLAHDDVVRLIGTCTGLLRLHVADLYFSESSDEESFQIHQARSKYNHRPRSIGKSAIGNTKKVANAKIAVSDFRSCDTGSIKQIRTSPRRTPEPLSRDMSPNLRRGSWDPLVPSPRVPQRPPLPYDPESPIPALPARKKVPDSVQTLEPVASSSSQRVDIVRVFPTMDSHSQSSSSNQSNSSMPNSSDFTLSTKANESFSNRINGRTQRLSNLSPSTRSASSLFTENLDPLLSSVYQAVVGYIGSVELPEIEEKKRLQALSACVRRLRYGKRVRSIVLLQIQSNGISLYSSCQNVQSGPPLAFYSSSVIAFCGAYSDDRRFFGLVTNTGTNKTCSCHVFMVEPKLLSHSEHLKRARAFGIQCTVLPVPKSGQVLGLQECVEFPATADPILNSILRLYRSDESHNQRSPSEASTRLESNNSSNSDSGIGFRDDSDRISARIYDIVEPEQSFDPRHQRRSPVPRNRASGQHRKSHFGQQHMSCSSHHPSTSKLYCKASPSSRTKDRMQSKVSNSSCFLPNDMQDHVGFSPFQTDPASLREILGIDDSDDGVNIAKPSMRRMSRNMNASRPPPHIEVSVLVTPPRIRESRNTSSRLTPMNASVVDCQQSPGTRRVSLSRSGTRSLDNLFSPEATQTNLVECKTALGSSTPALNQTTANDRDDFWEFKVPEPPKSKMEMGRVKKWSLAIEKLLEDPSGLQVFTEYLEREFSAENIHFYTACLRYKETFSDLTNSQRMSVATTIFQRFLQNGATDPVNVDFQARCQVEKALPSPTIDMLDLPLAQIYNLLKFDCYPRFLRSEVYQNYVSGVVQLPLASGDPSDSDQDSVKSHKLQHETRRRSLLPWNIKSRSKNKHRNKGDVDGLNSDLSFIQRTANYEGSDNDDRRKSYKLCRLVLPDNSTTVLPCVPGETLCTVVQRLLKKREFHYSAFEVVSASSGKALDLDMIVSDLSCREIRVEPKAFIEVELPHGWKVGIRSNPNRKIAEVLKSILSQHSLKLDAVVVFNLETDEVIDVKSPVGKVDGHNLLVRMKYDPKLEEITNQIREFGSYDQGCLDDDQSSIKTSSSQASGVFRGFLRRSSKKYKRTPKPTIVPNLMPFVCQNNGPRELVVPALPHLPEDRLAKSLPLKKASDEENAMPSRINRMVHTVDSPLSLFPTELSLAENSRNRKPIYITQSLKNES